GGKSLQLSSMMKNKGTIVATDIREYKLDDLKKRARRAGISNIRTNYWNGNPPNPKKIHKFNGVLVDAPCSCSGTWRRNPDARWTTNKNEVSELADIQLKLLRNASIAVKESGTLVYATCSFFKKENEDVVEKFLSICSSEFKLEPFINPFKNTLSDGMLRIYPWDSDCDCVFIAKFRRRQ
ncbi:MAG: RsmB/NOP family class I SAM-dependent RNA methyltransferase, partial [Candidatus Nanoarchaeia archaeon]